MLVLSRLFFQLLPHANKNQSFLKRIPLTVEIDGEQAEPNDEARQLGGVTFEATSIRHCGLGENLRTQQ